MLYPAPSSSSSHTHVRLRIARHSPCLACSDCLGLKPPQDVTVTIEDGATSLGDLGQYGSDDEDETQAYLDLCSCGHTKDSHGEDEFVLGQEEYARRARVALRLDELLQDVDKLTDFQYSDDDILSLRKQMRLPVSLVAPSEQSAPSPTTRSKTPSSPTSDASDSSSSHPPKKKRRITPSPFSRSSDDAADSEDDDQPLANRIPPPGVSPRKSTSGKRSGKKGPGKQTKGLTAPASFAPTNGTNLSATADVSTTNGKQANGINGHDHQIKLEDKMDEDQLDRLTTGVTVDAVGQGPAAGQPGTKEKAAIIELRKGVIQVTPIENDGQERSWVILTGLKSLFQKQLPKMPREYIARLVYDDNSKSLAIIKRGYKVVGGICYRPFVHRDFAEIVFFATASVDQVKGYGGMLMDHFKAHIKNTFPKMKYFLTYADNFAVGYFEKQGFTKEITLERSRWAGYIKDYEGGTIMQCTILDKVDYLDKVNMLAQQREAILTKIREKSKSHIIYSGLAFEEGEGGEIKAIDPQDVPGLRESGWNPHMAALTIRAKPKNPDYNVMEQLLTALQAHPHARIFLEPVDGKEVTDYYDVIKNPMDFATMEDKLESNQYDSLEAFLADAKLVFDNCRLYNPAGSIYAKSATIMDKFLASEVTLRRKTHE